jgi:uncharacterized membrane protein YjfL (UPF0719 family)
LVPPISKTGPAQGRVIINKNYTMPQPIINSIVYSLLGVGILVVVFVLVEILTPKHNLRKEILENKNIALALLAGFFMVSVAIIIASAIH